MKGIVNIVVVVVVVLLCSFTPFVSNEGNESDSDEPSELLIDVQSFAEDSYNHLGTKELFFKPYQLAVKGYFKLLAKGQLRNPDYLTVVDMTKSANEERMFIIDTHIWQVIHTSLVSHGMKTGEEFATDFSNENKSHQSSIGFSLTGEVYDGKHDKSLKLDGLEYSNDKMRERGVVIHAADYVSHEYIVSNGRLGRSYGCPAIPHQGYDEVIEKIKEGSLYFIYYPEKYYMKKSKFVNAEIETKVTCSGELAHSKN